MDHAETDSCLCECVIVAIIIKGNYCGFLGSTDT